MVKELTKVKELRLADKMSFAQQSRILLDAMDPKIKMLPSTPGCLDAIGPFRYAVQQFTFAITNINMSSLSRTDEIRAQLYNVCEHYKKA